MPARSFPPRNELALSDPVRQDRGPHGQSHFLIIGIGRKSIRRSEQTRRQLRKQIERPTPAGTCPAPHVDVGAARDVLLSDDEQTAYTTFGLPPLQQSFFEQTPGDLDSDRPRRRTQPRAQLSQPGRQQ